MPASITCIYNRKKCTSMHACPASVVGLSEFKTHQAEPSDWYSYPHTLTPWHPHTSEELLCGFSLLEMAFGRTSIRCLGGAFISLLLCMFRSNTRPWSEDVTMWNQLAMCSCVSDKLRLCVWQLEVIIRLPCVLCTAFEEFLDRACLKFWSSLRCKCQLELNLYNYINAQENAMQQCGMYCKCGRVELQTS